jgi:hypothetical protein
MSCRDAHEDGVARNNVDVHDGGRVVPGMVRLPAKSRRIDRAQRIFGVEIGAPHAFVDHVGHPHRRIGEAHRRRRVTRSPVVHRWR